MGGHKQAGTAVYAHVGHMYAHHQAHLYLCTQPDATHEPHVHTCACAHTPHRYTWVCTHTYMLLCTQSHYTYEYAYLWTPTHINTQTHSYTCRHIAHTRASIYTCISHTYTQGHTHAHLCTHIHTRAHSDMVWGGPREHPSFSDLRGRYSTWLCSWLPLIGKMIQSKIGKGRRRPEWSLGESRRMLPRVLCPRLT